MLSGSGIEVCYCRKGEDGETHTGESVCRNGPGAVVVCLIVGGLSLGVVG